MNPTDPGLTDNIEIKTYDGTNKLIIERSFRNLDPFTFYYQYPGPLIYVNEDSEITVQAGTQTNDLYVTVDFPCALNLTIKPQSPGFSIIPFNIDLSLGRVTSTFRVSVPESYPSGVYYVNWITLGEIIPPKYTPIKKTKVTVTRGGIITIGIPTLNKIPYGGNSLPAYFTVANGPDIGIEINANFLLNYAGITLSTTTIKFNAGDESVPLRVYSSSATNVTGGEIVQRGIIVLTLTGINKDLYQLPVSTLEFVIDPQDNIVPTIDAVDITSITKNEAIFSITASELCLVYYMIALQGTATPTLDEVRNKGPAPHSTTKSFYGSTQIDSSLTTTVTISDLVAETPYQIYVYIEDRGGNIAGATTVQFNTLSKEGIVLRCLNG